MKLIVIHKHKCINSNSTLCKINNVEKKTVNFFKKFINGFRQNFHALKETLEYVYLPLSKTSKSSNISNRSKQFLK